MRFKVSMINDQGEHHEETVIANNEEEAKKNFLGFYFLPQRSCNWRSFLP